MMVKMLRFFRFSFLWAGLFCLPLCAAEVAPFFNYEGQSVMITAARGINRQILSLFTQSTFPGTSSSTLFAGSYLLPGTVWSFPLRHRFEVGYQGNRHDDYQSYTHAVAGWMPEALVNLNPAYISFGAGPYLKSRATPVSGGRFAVVANLAFGVTFHAVNVEMFLRHHSNAYTASPNHGNDFFGIALSYNFSLHSRS